MGTTLSIPFILARAGPPPMQLNIGVPTVGKFIFISLYDVIIYKKRQKYYDTLSLFLRFMMESEDKK